jgi:large exoprotein involved in heme utilization and adhesion
MRGTTENVAEPTPEADRTAAQYTVFGLGENEEVAGGKGDYTEQSAANKAAQDAADLWTQVQERAERLKATMDQHNALNTASASSTAPAASPGVNAFAAAQEAGAGALYADPSSGSTYGPGTVRAEMEDIIARDPYHQNSLNNAKEQFRGLSESDFNNPQPPIDSAVLESEPMSQPVVRSGLPEVLTIGFEVQGLTLLTNQSINYKLPQGIGGTGGMNHLLVSNRAAPKGLHSVFKDLGPAGRSYTLHFTNAMPPNARQDATQISYVIENAVRDGGLGWKLNVSFRKKLL